MEDLIEVPVLIQFRNSVKDSGNLQLYAEYYGWTETIEDPNNPGTQIQNPVSMEQHIVNAFLLKVLKRDYKRVIHELKAQENAAIIEQMLKDQVG